jgi:hypothetical protein
MMGPTLFRLFMTLSLLVGGATALARPTFDENTVPDARVAQCRESLRRAVQYLLSEQQKDGSWLRYGRNKSDAVGCTALVTLALLSAGESPQSQAIRDAVDFLKRARSDRTYEIGLRAAVYSQLAESVRKQELARDLSWLLRATISDGPSRGMYTYSADHRGAASGDFSNSQYGVLGVWYAAEAGETVPVSYWREVEAAWRRGQQSDGGWGYQTGQTGSYASMTAAGVATLYLTYDQLHAAKDDSLLRRPAQRHLEQGMKWLGENFSPSQNAGRDVPLQSSATPREKGLRGWMQTGGGTWIHYMLFGYERVGEATGYTRFGDRSWFEEGADFLLRTQSSRGSWSGSGGPEVDTAYAVLFLSRGLAPVAIQKLQYAGRWNNRSRDVASIIRWLRRHTERHLNWQIVSLESATVSELDQSPILYVSGDRPVRFSEAQIDRLREYVDRGGTILFVNEGMDDRFAKSAMEAGKQLYPHLEFRPLPEDSPIYNANFAVSKLPDGPAAMSNGVREMLLLFTAGDWSWKWQSANSKSTGNDPRMGLIGNLLLYVTDSAPPRQKGDGTWVDAPPSPRVDRTVRLARVQFNGNWNPEPAGWKRLANILLRRQIALEVTPFDPSEQAIPRSFPVAHLTATHRFELTEAACRNLKSYLEGGGLLFFDAAGGSIEAMVAFEQLMSRLVPGSEFRDLPTDHPVYLAPFAGGMPAGEVRYRRSSLGRLPPGTAPRLRGVFQGDHLLAIASGEDISAGLVGYQAGGIVGYTPTSSVRLASNVVLFAQHREDRALKPAAR